MREQGKVSAAEYDEARAADLAFAPDPAPGDPAYAPSLEKVRREVERELGPGALERGGLRIHTTLETATQRSAVGALAGQKDGFNLALDARR